MKFINVSTENMEATRKFIEGEKEVSPGVFETDSWGAGFVEFLGDNSVGIYGDCCWDCFGKSTVIWIEEDVWTISEEDDDKFSDWVCDIDNGNYNSELTWDFATNTGTDYKKGES